MINIRPTTSGHTNSHVMQCMEVWGGNQAFDSSLVLAGLDMWVFSRPYGQASTGGDVYYVSSCATGRITRLLVADVAGHGASVHDLAIVLRTLMRRYVNYIDQSKFVQAMNAKFVELSLLGNFATAVAMTYFGPTRRLSISNAGHPPPLVYRLSEQRWSYLEHHRQEDDRTPANLPLGIIDLSDYDQFNAELEVGDYVLSYTDSLPESCDSAGKMLFQEGLLQLVNEIPIDDPSTFIARLLEKLRTLCDGNLLADDVTVLLCRANGTAAATRLVERLKAPIRVARGIFRSWRDRSEPPPWPEASIANIGGMLLPALNRVTPASGFPEVTKSSHSD